MKLIIASNNAHKIREIKRILGTKFDPILSLREAGIDHETVEDGITFIENARKKAQSMVESAKLSSDFIMEQMEKVRKEKETARLGEELAAARRSIRENLRAQTVRVLRLQRKIQIFFCLLKLDCNRSRSWHRNIGIRLSYTDRQVRRSA